MLADCFLGTAGRNVSDDAMDHDLGPDHELSLLQNAKVV
jgi:hypothetical protein